MTIEAQLEATLKTSELEIEKIGDFGAHGMHLKRVAKRLGAIFNYCQSRRSQSESEVNHFTLDLTDINLLAYNVKEILNESLVWSVLIEQKGTKSKSTDNLNSMITSYIQFCTIFWNKPQKKRNFQVETL
jgi:superoxide dismutase